VRFGIQGTMEILAFIGMIVGAIIYISVRVHPPIDHQNDGRDIYKNSHPVKDFMMIICTKQAWAVAIYGMLMYAPITILGIAWGVPFIQKYYDISEAVAASVISTMFLGAALGSPVVALISDRLKNRRVPMLFGAAMSSLLWLSVLFIDGIPLGIMYVLFFSGGIFYTFKTLSFASICDLMPKSLSGISIAFVNMIVMSTGIIFHPLIGYLIEFHWRKSAALNDLTHYTLSDYRFGLAMIPVSVLLALAVLIFVQESHPESDIVKDYETIPDL
jgi:MFS family permease